MKSTDHTLILFLLSCILLSCLLLWFFSCEKNSTPVEEKNPHLTVTVEDVAVTEAWLQLRTAGITRDDSLLLLRNDSTVFRMSPVQAYTTLYDSTLLPAHSYTYQAILRRMSFDLAKSEVVNTTTMDTTSHEFTWELNSFGIYPSTLFDVAIIDEDDIWAVGEIHTSETDRFDSLGNWVPPFNALHWNGHEWELKHIRTNACGGVIYPHIRAIIAFLPDNILFAHVDGSITHYDGYNFTNDCSLINQLNGSVNKIWGVSDNDFFVVGWNGFIAHYDGTAWQKLESNTEVDLLDVWGSPDGGVVWACGYKDFVGTVLLKITGDRVEKVYDDNDYWYTIRQDSLSGVLTSVWTDRENILFLVSPNGMYRAPTETRGEARRFALNGGYFPGFPRCLRGRAINDIFAVGDFSFIGHFNGHQWHHYTEFQGRIRFRSITLIDGLGVFVGTDISTGEAIILTAR
jgi:hypothetical protein